MIELDIDLSYLTKHFNIGLAQIQQYAKTRSIKEIVKAEAEKGNKAAQNFELEVLRDPKEIAKLFNKQIIAYNKLSTIIRVDAY